MLIVFLIIILLILLLNRRLLLTLIILEVLGFIIIYFVSVNFGYFTTRDYLVLIVFSIFVIEGVIALCGLIILVSFRGRDYLISSSFLKV